MTFTDTPSAPVAIADTVLVVEDDVLIRMVIAQYLRECGYRVIEAAHAHEAITVLQEPELKIDVVLSDVEMPGSMDGFGLSQWVRKHRQGLAIILVGSPASAADAAADLCESGPMLAKPYEPQIAVDHIRRLLAERKSRKER
jgi:DNA-binding NtrC family response regulator